MEDYITTKELCEWLRVAESTVSRWRNEGMPCIGKTRTFRYKKSEVLNWLEQKGDDTMLQRKEDKPWGIQVYVGGRVFDYFDLRFIVSVSKSFHDLYERTGMLGSGKRHTLAALDEVVEILNFDTSHFEKTDRAGMMLIDNMEYYAMYHVSTKPDDNYRKEMKTYMERLYDRDFATLSLIELVNSPLAEKYIKPVMRFIISENICDAKDKVSDEVKEWAEK